MCLQEEAEEVEQTIPGVTKVYGICIAKAIQWRIKSDYITP